MFILGGSADFHAVGSFLPGAGAVVFVKPDQSLFSVDPGLGVQLLQMSHGVLRTGEELRSGADVPHCHVQFPGLSSQKACPHEHLQTYGTGKGEEQDGQDDLHQEQIGTSGRIFLHGVLLSDTVRVLLVPWLSTAVK